jgi:predicted MFS family arabinose efflux permease
MSEPTLTSSKSLRVARMTRSELALIIVLVAIHFTHMVDFVIIMPLGKRLMSELQISPDQFGFIVAVYAIAAGTASLLASFVMDRFDRKSVLLTMYAGFGVSTLFCGLAESYEMLLLARTLAGIFGGLAAVSIMAVIGDVFPHEKRGRATGAITSSFAISNIVGLPLGLVLAEHYGRGAPFIVLAVLSAVVWVIGCVRLPSVREHLKLERGHPIDEFKLVISNSNHQRAFLFSFFLVIGTFTIGSFVAPYLSKLNDWTERDLAEVYLASGICSFLGMFVVGQLSDRMHRLTLFRILGFGALVVGLIVTNLPAGPIYVAAIAISVFTVFAAGRIVPAQAMILGSAQMRVRGAFMSLNTAVQHLGTGTASMVAGLMIGESEDGKLTGFPLVGVVAAVAAAISLVLGGLLRPAQSEQATETKSLGPTDAVVEAAVA